jgi:uncharacterized protein (TIGR00297 family)
MPSLIPPKTRHVEERAAPARLHWQSRAVLLLVTPAAGIWLTLLLPRLVLPGAGAGDRLAAEAGLAAGAALGLLVLLARAATGAGALTGGLLMGCFCLTTPGWRSSAWPLIAMLVLTLGATRVGRARKQRLGTAESRHGRGAAQVAANLGVAALAGTLINAEGQLVALTVLLAALAEAGADTLASELGQALRGTPRLITTLAPVPAGTDGGITVAGTLIGLLGAAVIAAVGVLAMALPWSVAWIAAGAGVAGLLFDSLLGATLERSGWLNNDAVNFLSTLFAAGVALWWGGAVL